MSDDELLVDRRNFAYPDNDKVTEFVLVRLGDWGAVMLAEQFDEMSVEEVKAWLLSQGR